MLARCELFILMPRYYRRRRSVVVRPKKKWASNMTFTSYEILPGGTGTQPVPVTNLVINSAQANTPTPTIIKAGNFKINADVTYSVSTTTPISHLVAVVVFLPEGIDPLSNAALGALLTAHPEYIIAWRQLDTSYIVTGSSPGNVQNVTFSSRLKRNLNSGDRIVFGILDQTPAGTVTSIRVALTAQYWTCAN